MLGFVSKGMDSTCLLRSSDKMPPRVYDYRNVPRTQMVDHVTSEPTTFYPWDLKNRAAVSYQPLLRPLKGTYVRYINHILLIRD